MSQAKHAESFLISQPAEVLFPLFSAEGEKHWVPGWDYISISGGSDLHEDYVFLTQNHDHAAGNAIWIVKRHEPDSYFVEFYKIEPDEKVGIISVKCNSISDSETNVSVAYEYIALSEEGREFIAKFSSQVFKKFIGEWKQLLEEYFDASR
jgi:hypothetical protein